MNKSVVLFLSALFCLTILGYGMLSTYESGGPLPILGEDDHHVEEFKLKDQHTQLFSSEGYKEKIWVVNYFFTACPSVCPKMMRTMQEVHNIVRNDQDVILLSFTVDPKRDSSERLLEYLERHNVDHSSWKLLTGDKKTLYRLARQSFLISATDGGGDEFDFIHSENIMVLDSQQRIRGKVSGTEEDADQKILNIISKLKKQA